MADVCIHTSTSKVISMQSLGNRYILDVIHEIVCIFFMYAGWHIAHGFRMLSMKAATLFDSLPQSDTIGLPGGLLLVVVQRSADLWSFDSM